MRPDLARSSKRPSVVRVTEGRARAWRAGHRPPLLGQPWRPFALVAVAAAVLVAAGAAVLYVAGDVGAQATPTPVATPTSQINSRQIVVSTLGSPTVAPASGSAEVAASRAPSSQPGFSPGPPVLVQPVTPAVGGSTGAARPSASATGTRATSPAGLPGTRVVATATPASGAAAIEADLAAIQATATALAQRAAGGSGAANATPGRSPTAIPTAAPPATPTS